MTEERCPACDRVQGGSGHEIELHAFLRSREDDLKEAVEMIREGRRHIQFCFAGCLKDGHTHCDWPHHAEALLRRLSDASRSAP